MSKTPDETDKDKEANKELIDSMTRFKEIFFASLKPEGSQQDKSGTRTALGSELVVAIKGEDASLLPVLDKFSKGLVKILSAEKEESSTSRDPHAELFLQEQLKSIRDLYEIEEFEAYQGEIAPILDVRDPISRKDGLLAAYNHLRTQRDAVFKQMEEISPEDEEIISLQESHEALRRMVTKLGFLIEREIKEFEKGFQESGELAPSGPLGVFENVISQWAKRPTEKEFGGESWLKVFQQYLDLNPKVAKPLREYFKENIAELKLLHETFTNAKTKEPIKNLLIDLNKRLEQINQLKDTETNRVTFERLQQNYSIKRTKLIGAEISWLKKNGFWTEKDEEKFKNEQKNPEGKLSSAYKESIGKKYQKAVEEQKMWIKVNWLKENSFWKPEDNRKLTIFPKGEVTEDVITWVNEKFNASRAQDTSKKTAKKEDAPIVRGLNNYQKMRITGKNEAIAKDALGELAAGKPVKDAPIGTCIHLSAERVKEKTGPVYVHEIQVITKDGPKDYTLFVNYEGFKVQDKNQKTKEPMLFSNFDSLKDALGIKEKFRPARS